MVKSYDEVDITFMRQAIVLANMAEREGNLPVGSLITWNGEVVSQGPSRVYQPRYDLTRHAEMEAVRALDPTYWKKKDQLVIYTTLEPCLMCLGAILLFGIPRVVFGAGDDYGGTQGLADHLPAFFKERFQNTAWVGPVLPEECNPLHARLLEIETNRAD
jgi:tRNA(adenine34) deaminase